MSQFTSYIIRLTPVGKFFFGGERNFSGMDNEHYFVKSRLFPQQTSLLGLLRFQLLRASGILTDPFSGHAVDPERATDAAELIGEKSFEINNETGFDEKKFGVIGGISHLFLSKGNNFYHKNPIDGNATFEAIPGRYTLVGMQGGFEKSENALPYLHGYDPKQKNEMSFISNNGATVKISDIFQKTIQTGITKHKNHFPLQTFGTSSNALDEEEDGFFKQLYWKMQPGFAFSFLAWLKPKAAEMLQTFIANYPLTWMGGEKSVFKMDMHLWSQPLEKLAPNYKHAGKSHTRVVLLSDAYVTPDIYQKAVFAKVGTREFRHLKTTVRKTQHYYKRSSNTKEVKRSARLFLLRRGSVFYCQSDSTAALVAALEAPQSFRQIGYNAFIALNTNSIFSIKPAAL